MAADERYIEVDGSGVTRAIDREAGVVLYVTGMGPQDREGMTAVPLEDTDLE